MNFNKYESYIRIGHTATGSYGSYICTDLENFPTPATPFSNTLADVDYESYTDIQGFTHRNRIRNDVNAGLEFTYPILSEDDLSYILNRISPAWIYIELINKKTKLKEIHKVYASDKKFNTTKVWFNATTQLWEEQSQALSFTLVEE